MTCEDFNSVVGSPRFTCTNHASLFGQPGGMTISGPPGCFAIPHGCAFEHPLQVPGAARCRASARVMNCRCRVPLRGFGSRNAFLAVCFPTRGVFISNSKFQPQIHGFKNHAAMGNNQTSSANKSRHGPKHCDVNKGTATKARVGKRTCELGQRQWTIDNENSVFLARPTRPSPPGRRSGIPGSRFAGAMK